MSDGAFRDTSAAVERASRLEEENSALHDELAKLRQEVADLRAQLDGKDFENGDAILRRSEEDRAELRGKVVGLEADCAARDAEIAALRRQEVFERNNLFDRILSVFRSGR